MIDISRKFKRFFTKRKLRGHDIASSRNIFHQIYLYFLYKKNKALIINNKKIKNFHDGERCFILFTGTSVKDFDADIIGNEKVIASGLAFLKSDFKKYNTVAYFNPAPWEPRSLKFFDFLAGGVYKNTSKHCKVFFDITSYPYAGEILNSKIDDTYFMSTNANYISTQDIESDLHKSNNIQEGSFSCGLGIASYLGFKEIYLLGADYLTSPIIYGHFYDGYHEIAESSGYKSYQERASWMIEHVSKKGCRVINVIKSEKQISSIDSITFDELQNHLS